MLENAVKTEDRKHKKPEINPAVLLENLDIDDYYVAFTDKVVTLVDKRHFQRVSNYFEKKGEGKAFYAHGWLWKLEEELA